MRAILLFSAAIVMSGQQVNAQDTSSRSEQAYAQRYGVNLTEARKNIDAQHRAGKLRAELESTEPETFAGMYVDHGKTLRIVAKFKGDASSIMAKHAVDFPVSTEGSSITLAELRSAQEETYRQLKGHGIESASQINERTGELEFFVNDPIAAQGLGGQLKHAKLLHFKKAKDLRPGGEASVEGGRSLASGGAQACTSGFVVYKTGLSNNSTRYILTAGHCPNTLTYNGVSLPFVGEKYAAPSQNDFQWHSRGTFVQPTNEIYEGLSSNLKITAVWPYSNMMVGDWICKWGAVTGFTCGNISSLNYNSLGDGGFVRVDGGGVDLSSPGDSGGPWYYDAYNEAWGIHQNHASDNTLDAVFMPVSRISVAGLAVLTTP